jgi:N utilization substance protein A
MVKALFAMEVPELASGSIEIKAVAREAGSRTKIAVLSMADNIDPIGSCVGQRGARVQTVMNELGGEKIDIIEYSDDSVRFIVNALSPAKVISVKLEEANKLAKAYVNEDQLSLAIGKGGQNVRLAAKLSGWKIDVLKDETPVETAEGETTEGEELKIEGESEEANDAQPVIETPVANEDAEATSSESKE